MVSRNASTCGVYSMYGLASRKRNAAWLCESEAISDISFGYAQPQLMQYISMLIDCLDAVFTQDIVFARVVSRSSRGLNNNNLKNTLQGRCEYIHIRKYKSILRTRRIYCDSQFTPHTPYYIKLLFLSLHYLFINWFKEHINHLFTH